MTDRPKFTVLGGDDPKNWTVVPLGDADEEEVPEGALRDALIAKAKDVVRPAIRKADGAVDEEAG